jgi:3-deoxy-D-manno-octulosonic-acid transferase
LSWILNGVYLALITLLSPLLLFRRVVHGKYRDGWAEKLLGRLPTRASSAPCLWLHAVSVGEVLQLKAVMPALEAAHPSCEFYISTTTATGHAVARREFPQHEICYFPLDFSWAVRRAIARIRPTAVVLVELELWPNFIRAVAQAGVPLILINGRISQHSFRGYRRIRPLMRRLLSAFQRLAVQNDIYAQRLRELGAPAERIVVTGSIKFDGVATDRQNARTEELRQFFGIEPGQRVFIAGSTQHPEEDYALETYLQLHREFPGLRLLLVPRHQERFEEVAQMVQRHGLPLIRRSRPPASAEADTERNRSKPPAVLLLDTLGELSACWGLADIAFVGGSLTKRGGQNMIEPAAYGAAVLFGPNTQNFRDVVEALLSQDAARVVTDGAHLTATVRELLQQPAAARELGATAQQVVLAQRGAAAKTVAIIAELIEQGSSARPGRAA